LVAFLGGTIGNYPPVPRKDLLARITAGMKPGDRLLLGTDLVKDPGRIELAYNDPAGVTEAFNKNILFVINRELGADFDPSLFDHVARWDAEEEWVDLGLRSRVDHRVRVEALDLEVAFAAGEVMRTEVSAKFRIEPFSAELAAVGLDAERWFTDHNGDFAVSLSVFR
jgi:L-histidine N-alpha-methyltransferase